MATTTRVETFETGLFGSLEKLGKKINAWLESHSQVNVINISIASPRENTLSAIVVYKVG